MSNLTMTTYQSVYQPSVGNLDQHKNNSDAWAEPYKREMNHHNGSPTITHGDTSGWSNYSRLSNAEIKGAGPQSKLYGDGSAYCTWGSSGSKHTEIFKIGNSDNSRWAPRISGVGFEVLRHRTDSTDFNNDNANQHCIFVKRYGAQFKHRTNGNERFWSSPVLAESGEAKGSTFGKDGGVATWEFYNSYFAWSNTTQNDWLLDGFWVNLASRDTSKVGTATTKVYIFNLRFYYDFNKERIVQPAVRPYAQRNTLYL